MTSLTAIPLISKLSKSVIRILGCNPGPMTLQGTNTYLVGTGSRRILIDTGDSDTSTEYTKLLERVLNEERAIIEHLVITHWHHDHIGGAAPVQKFLQTRQPKESPAIVWKLPRSTEDSESTEEERSVAWNPLKDFQLLEVEGAQLRVRHTPGHTTDHACLSLEQDNILFSGDCILGEGTAVFEDLYEYMQSLERILEMRPKTIYPGHGPVIEDPVPRIRFYIRHRQQREADILTTLQENGTSGPLSEMDIVRKLYKDTPENLWMAAAHNVSLHLEKLCKERKVRGQKGAWYTYLSKYITIE